MVTERVEASRSRLVLVACGVAVALLASLLVPPVSVGAAASAWAYHTLGRRITATVGTGTTTYTYDPAGQLNTATPSSGPATTYTYDGAGRRISETVGTNYPTQYIYGPAGDLYAAFDPADGLAVVRAAFPGAPIFAYNSIVDDEYRFHFLDWDTTTGGPTELISTSTTHQDHTELTTESTTNLTRTPGAPWAVAQTTASTDALAADIHRSVIDSAGTDLAAGDAYTEWGDSNQPPAHEPALGYRGELHIAGKVHLRARDYDPTTAHLHHHRPPP